MSNGSSTFDSNDWGLCGLRAAVPGRVLQGDLLRQLPAGLRVPPGPETVVAWEPVWLGAFPVDDASIWIGDPAELDKDLCRGGSSAAPLPLPAVYAVTRLYKQAAMDTYKAITHVPRRLR